MDKIIMPFAYAIWISCMLSSCSSSTNSKGQINGWNISLQKYNADRIELLSDNIESGKYKNINSVVIIKDGELLTEKYFNGASRNKTHDVRSVGKTFASAMLGIAISEGYIENENLTLGTFYDLQDHNNFSQEKADIKVVHLLTMSSGFEGDDDDPDSPGHEEKMYPQSNWVRWTLNLPMAKNRHAGDSSVYFTAGVVVLGDIIHQAVPGGLETYAEKKLFGPLGITNYRWQYTPQNVANTAGGIQLTPLDFAKFGQLYVGNGWWQGNQIIPESWVKRSLVRYYETKIDNNGYGYLWWNKVYEVNGRSFDTFYCSGNGGNKIFVIKELNAVIVVTGSAYNTNNMHKQVDEMMEQYILPAMM